MRLEWSIRLGRLTVGFLGTVVGLLATAAGRTSQGNEDERPLTEGAGLMGEYNLRTRQIDTGLDPSGWYEDDPEERI